MVSVLLLQMFFLLVVAENLSRIKTDSTADPVMATNY